MPHNAVNGEISGIGFWHLFFGMPDFAAGGCRYTKVLKGIRRNSRLSRKIPVNIEMIHHITSLQKKEDRHTVGIAGDALVGFFFLHHVGELEHLRWTDVLLSADAEGDACLRLELPRSKTDQ